MGKAAKNEKLKAQANWYNGISIGTMVAGALVPYFGALKALSELSPTTPYTPQSPIQMALQVSIWIGGFAVAIWLSKRTHQRALEVLSQIAD